MKIILLLSLLSGLTSCADAKEKMYTGSTPADKEVRSFIGIATTDSIDFIRWKLTLHDGQYKLYCHFGISKPNTNGFMEGGTVKELSGRLDLQGHVYTLWNADKQINMYELNENLLHFMDAGKQLLVGNGGWSYTLNSMMPVTTEKIFLHAALKEFPDSILFQGRTPCDVPGVVPEGKTCYKLKWYIVLYTNPGNHYTYKLFGTPYRIEGGRTGTWLPVKGKGDRVLYQLNDDRGNGFLWLVKVDEEILLFTDKGGNLLTGNEDFSYTLNRIVK